MGKIPERWRGGGTGGRGMGIRKGGPQRRTRNIPPSAGPPSPFPKNSSSDRATSPNHNFLLSRWMPYTPIGKRVPGTRFIAFKVPLKQNMVSSLRPAERFTAAVLLERCPNLGLVIDLTNTNRYYDKADLLRKGIEYEKITSPGQTIPREDKVATFFKVVDCFLDRHPRDDTLIGVHCTHGVNRTGYFIIRYMIQRMTCPFSTAKESVERARGYNIERPNYVEHLRSCTEMVPKYWPGPKGELEKEVGGGSSKAPPPGRDGNGKSSQKAPSRPPFERHFSPRPEPKEKYGSGFPEKAVYRREGAYRGERPPYGNGPPAGRTPPWGGQYAGPPPEYVYKEEKPPEYGRPYAEEKWRQPGESYREPPPREGYRPRPYEEDGRDRYPDERKKDRYPVEYRRERSGRFDPLPYEDRGGRRRGSPPGRRSPPSPGVHSRGSPPRRGGYRGGSWGEGGRQEDDRRYNPERLYYRPEDRSESPPPRYRERRDRTPEGKGYGREPPYGREYYEGRGPSPGWKHLSDPSYGKGQGRKASQPSPARSYRKASSPYGGQERRSRATTPPAYRDPSPVLRKKYKKEAKTSPPAYEEKKRYYDKTPLPPEKLEPYGRPKSGEVKREREYDIPSEGRRGRERKEGRREKSPEKGGGYGRVGYGGAKGSPGFYGGSSYGGGYSGEGGFELMCGSKGGGSSRAFGRELSPPRGGPYPREREDRFYREGERPPWREEGPPTDMDCRVIINQKRLLGPPEGFYPGPPPQENPPAVFAPQTPRWSSPPPPVSSRLGPLPTFPKKKLPPKSSSIRSPIAKKKPTLIKRRR